MSQTIRIPVIDTMNSTFAMTAVRTPAAYLFLTARRNAMFPPMNVKEMITPRSVGHP